MTHQRVQAAVARGDDELLFAEHASRLQAVVSRSVRTSPANVEDACGFAWLQLVRHRPAQSVAFAWLCTTAVREAIKLDRRSARAVGLEQAADIPANPSAGPEGRLELILAGEQIMAGRLRKREARVLALSAAGYSRKEMAELTGSSGRAVERHLGRARRRLRVAGGAPGAGPR